MFTDGTYILRQYLVIKKNSFVTTSLFILNNKEQVSYELLFEELKKNAIKYNNNIIVTPKILHCDFEKEESLYYNNYKRKIEGVWKKKRILLSKTDEINDLIKKYKKKESELIDKKYDKNDIIDL
ncbi:hypothetical protein U3516DRAFT_749924 [Neocallimastix sp. 'constans']